VKPFSSSIQFSKLCTIQMVDVATGWSELRAVLGRSYLAP